MSAKDFFDDGLRASRHTDQHRVCLHIERCGKQLLFRTLELEFLLEASREQPTDRETSVGPLRQLIITRHDLLAIKEKWLQPA